MEPASDLYKSFHSKPACDITQEDTESQRHQQCVYIEGKNSLYSDSQMNKADQATAFELCLYFAYYHPALPAIYTVNE